MYAAALLVMVVIITFRFFNGSKAIHKDFFMFGVAYYLLLPGLVYDLGLLVGAPGVGEWFLTVSDFYENYSIGFIFNTMVWVFAFFVGCVFFRSFIKLAPRKKAELVVGNSLSYQCPRPMVWVLVFLLIFVFVYYVYIGRDSLFSGYTVEYNSFVLGGISTVSIFLYGIYLGLVNQSARILSFFILSLLLLVCLTLLLSGSRMYVLVPFAGFVSLYLVRHSRIVQRFKICAVIISLGVTFVLVGVVRMFSFSLDSVLYIFLAEPVFTSYSLATFWSGNSLPLVEVPLSFLSGFFNLIPNFFWPGKSNYIVSLQDTGYFIETPLGAESIVVSLIVNFGLLGSPVVLFSLGFLLEMLFYLKARSDFYLMSYVGLVSVIPFMFFRDPFSVSIKVSLTLSLFLPVLLYAFSVLFQRKRKSFLV